MTLISYLGGYLLIKNNHDKLNAEVNSRNGLILQKIDGGYSVSGIGQNENATEIVIPLSYKGKKIIAIEKNVFKNCSSLTSVTISDNVTQIGESAFENCSSLTTLKIGTGLTNIDRYAFRGTKLKNVYFSDINKWVQINGVSNVTSYGKSYKDLYLNDVLVTEVNIDKATYVNSRAFYNCTNVTKITFGTQLKKINEYAFSGCQIENIYYAGDINEWVQIDGLRYLMAYGKSSKKLYLNDQLLTNEVNITTATAVKDFAFYGYYSLSKVVLGNSVTSLGNSVFSNCNLLISLTVGKNLKNIGEEAFYNSEIENIYLQDVNHWIQIDGLDYLMKYGSTDKNIYVNNVLLTEVNFSSATTISNYSFYGYKKLTKVTFGEQVTLIGAYSFLNCSSLSNAYFENSIGWFTTSDPTKDNTTVLTLNDSSKNAYNLRYSYYGQYYLKRNQNV